jgi:hypothetical protein
MNQAAGLAAWRSTPSKRSTGFVARRHGAPAEAIDDQLGGGGAAVGE